MGKPQRRKGNLAKNKFQSRRMKNKHYTRDLDLIYKDMQPENAQKIANKKADITKPGLGQFYCIPCAKHNVSERALTDHRKTKFCKRRLKLLKKEKPFDHKEAEKYNF